MKKFRFIIGWIMIICTVNLSAQTVNGMQFCNNNEAKNDSLSRTTLKVVINGLLCEIEDKIPADTLDENGRIQQIINEEFADLKEYEITDCKILKNIQIGCGNPQTPLLIITTKLPYYRNEHLVGNYRGKQGKLIYELSLNADSTYTFNQTRNDKRCPVPKIRNCGIWKISKGNVILISSSAPDNLLAGGYNFLDTIQTKVNTTKKLTLSKEVWQNKKQITLNRVPNE